MFYFNNMYHMYSIQTGIKILYRGLKIIEPGRRQMDNFINSYCNVEETIKSLIYIVKKIVIDQHFKALASTKLDFSSIGL